MTATWDTGADDLADAGEVDLMLVERGLRAYAHRVAAGLGLGAAATSCEVAERSSAYIALDDRVTGWADQDAALVWDIDHGWAVAVETHSGEDLLIVAYHGSPLVPPPPAVIAFTTDTLARPPAVSGPTVPPRRGDIDQLANQLLAYLPGG